MAPAGTKLYTVSTCVAVSCGALPPSTMLAYLVLFLFVLGILAAVFSQVEALFERVRRQKLDEEAERLKTEAMSHVMFGSYECSIYLYRLV